MRPDPTSPSDSAVRAATGHGWRHWFDRLDALGAHELDHRSIVALLRDEEGLDQPWWQQTVAVAYEKARGLRAPVGETVDAGFQVGAQRTIACSADDAWAWLVEGPGRTFWIGPCQDFGAVRGARYRCDDGTEGEVRSVRSGRHLRLTWTPEDWPRASTLQLRVTDKGNRCVVSFHQERLADAETREAMKLRLRSALDALQARTRVS